MRAHHSKTGIDWSQPFVQVQTKEEFDKIECSSTGLLPQEPKPEPTSTLLQPETQRNNIVIPKIQITQPLTLVKPHARVLPNYIRLKAELNIPKPDTYELTEVDDAFVERHSDIYLYRDGKSVLTRQLLVDIIVYLQKKAGKKCLSISTKSQQLELYIKEYRKQILDIENLQNFIKTVYAYWRNRRQQLKFPMLRKLWRPKPDTQPTYHLAFKQRLKQKKALRRHIRYNEYSEQEYLTSLQSQHKLAVSIAERVYLVNKLKTQRIENELEKFHEECKEYFGVPEFMKEFKVKTQSDRLQLEAQIKEKKAQFKKIIGDQEDQEQEQYKLDEDADQSINETEKSKISISLKQDYKKSIAYFLANLIPIVYQFGITFQTFTQPIPQNAYDSDYQEQSAYQAQQYRRYRQQGPNCNVQAYYGYPIQRKRILNGPKLRLYRNGNFIHRVISDDQGYQLEEEYKVSNFYQYKRRQLRSYYFGDGQDEPVQKTLKKTVSSGFKKYLNQHKLNNAQNPQT